MCARLPPRLFAEQKSTPPREGNYWETLMIFTVTLNPAIDYVLQTDDLRIGEVNRALRTELFYGGKGINVSGVLTSFKVPNTALGFAAGFTGKALCDGLDSLGINNDFVTLKSGMTRINVKLKSPLDTDINTPGPFAEKTDIRRLSDKLKAAEKGDFICLSGSIPQGIDSGVYSDIMGEFEGINFIVDTTGEALFKALPHRPFLIKPNIDEFSELFDEEISSDTEIIDSAKKLQEMGARNVLVSLGPNGALLVCEDGTCHKCGVPPGVARNTVGAGDSMIAGFLYEYLKNGDMAAALKTAVAAGSATAYSDQLATFEYTRKLLEEM